MEFRRDEASLINDIDYYKILKLKKDCSKEDIENTFRKLSKKYHPDRGGDTEVYSLIQDAYQTLINDTDRKEYDSMRQKIFQSDNWLDLKQGSKKHYESMDYRNPNELEKLSFGQKMKELDDKRGITRDLESNLDEVDAKKKYNELMSERSAMDTNKPDRIFDTGRFDGGQFNALWDKKHGKQGEKEIVIRKGAPMAFNDVGGPTFASLEDEQFGDPFVDNDEGTDIYGSKKFGSKSDEPITRTDLEGLNKVDYYSGHSKKDKNFKTNMKDKLRERQNATTDINKMKFEDFHRDDFGGYGIHDKLGYEFSDRLTIDTANSGDLKSRYDKMMQDRNRLD
jgi:curved DNA-binding protein CbpA